MRRDLGFVLPPGKARPASMTVMPAQHHVIHLIDICRFPKFSNRIACLTANAATKDETCD
jgi:hypothetical protein